MSNRAKAIAIADDAIANGEEVVNREEYIEAVVRWLEQYDRRITHE